MKRNQGTTPHPWPYFDMAQLRAVYREVSALADAGELTRERFEALFKQARELVGDYTPALEGLLMEGMRHGFVDDERHP